MLESGHESIVTCPFCGLLCDDVRVAREDARLAVRAPGCARSAAGFAQSAHESACARIDGAPADLDAALRAAAQLLAQAHAPLIGGMATDVAGARAALALADRLGAVLDHHGSAAKLRNLRVLQDSGWVTTTFAEVRNRADLVVFVGGDIEQRFPRFGERLLAPTQTLFGTLQRRCVHLGYTPARPARDEDVYDCPPARLAEACASLRALLLGRRLQAQAAAGIDMARWRALLEQLRAARYAVFVWSAADLDFAHAELAVRALAELIRELNRGGRAAALPVGGSDGDFSADGVLLWQTGVPFRTSLASGAPVHDPWQFDAARLLASDEADALLWISAFDETCVPPPAALPTVVLGRPGMHCAPEPAVFIPVGTPGVEHDAHLLRGDKVVALRLRALRAGPPSVAQVLERLLAELPR